MLNKGTYLSLPVYDCHSFDGPEIGSLRYVWLYFYIFNLPKVGSAGKLKLFNMYEWMDGWGL